MTEHWYERLTGSLEQKKRYRAYKARVKTLPPSYEATTRAIERYLLHVGAISDGETLVRMLEDLVDLTEQSAASSTPVRDVVGDDPVEFAEDFLRNYRQGQWANKERERLREQVARATDGDATTTDPTTEPEHR